VDAEEIMSLFYKFSSFANVIGMGHGVKAVRGTLTGQPAIVFLVKNKLPKERMERASLIPNKINGQLTDVIEVGDIQFLTPRNVFVRPAPPGVSIGHYRSTAGTLGAIVRDLTTNELLILSNNHVLANLTDGTDTRAAIGDPILQPGPIDGGNQDKIIGHLVRFVPIHKEEGFSACRIARAFEAGLNRAIKPLRRNYCIRVMRKTKLYNTVDCALARPVSSDSVTSEIEGIGPVNGIAEPQIGILVKKSGRSTGVTTGKILAVNVTVRVGTGARETCLFSDQVLAEAMSLPGDSGALVLSEENLAVGLLFAGSDKATLFNRIDNVVSLLDVTFSGLNMAKQNS